MSNIITASGLSENQTENQTELDKNEIQNNECEQCEGEFQAQNATETELKQMEEQSAVNELVEAAQNVSKTPEGFEANKVFVGGIGREVDDESLREFFSNFGEVKSGNAIIMRDPFTQISRGFGFVTFENEYDCHKMLDDSSSVRKMMNGRSVEIKRARARTEVDNSSESCIGKKIFIRNLPTVSKDVNPTTEKIISDQKKRDEFKSIINDHFCRFGSICETNVNVHRGFAFVTFDCEKSASSALESTEPHLICSCKCIVTAAKPRSGNSNRNQMNPMAPHPGMFAPQGMYQYSAGGYPPLFGNPQNAYGPAAGPCFNRRFGPY